MFLGTRDKEVLRHLTPLLSCILLTNEANIKVMEKLRISCHGICYKALGLQCDKKKVFGK